MIERKQELALSVEATIEPIHTDPIVFHWGKIIASALERAETFVPSRGKGSAQCPHPIVALCRLLAAFDAREGITYYWQHPCPVAQNI